jgi:hypothetical protein
MTDRSPLPESRWIFRRIYVYGATLALAVHIFWTSLRTADVATLRETIRNDQGLILLFALLYLAGASTEAIAHLFASARGGAESPVSTNPVAKSEPAAGFTQETPQ